MKRNGKLIQKKYLEFFVPTVLTAMATNFSSIVDGGIIGNLMDSTALSVINILMPLVQFYFAVSILFGIAASAMIAGSRGRDGTDTVTGNRTLSVVCVSLGAVSIVLMAIQFIFTDGIISLLTPVEELRPLVRQYYLPFIAATPVTLFMSCLVHVVRTDNRPKFATYIILAANAVNLVLDIVFIRLFNLGLTGASLATVIGNTVALAMIISHFRSKKCTVHFDSSALKNHKMFFNYLADVLENGASGALGIMLTTCKLFFLNLLIQHYGGKAGMVAFSAVSMCQILESAFVTGGCQSMVPVVSLLYGEKDYNGIKTAFRTAARILAVSCILITAVLEAVPQLAAMVYGIVGAELQLTCTAVRISALMLCGDALTFLFIYMYMCTENKTFSTVISVLNGIVLIVPTGLILAKHFGINGVWMSLTVSQYIALLLVPVGALIIRRRKKADSIYLIDEKSNNEVVAFSVSEDVENTDLLRCVSEAANADTAEALCGILDIISRAETSAKRVKNTDVRICRDDGYRVFIKSSGAVTGEKDFAVFAEKLPSFTYSETIGFTQINFDI